MTREIVVDTETTGLDALNGDRIVEIRAVELVNRCPLATRSTATCARNALYGPTRSRCTALLVSADDRAYLYGMRLPDRRIVGVRPQ
jgi:DNA polymerase III epsilon subunit-like protein